MTEHEPQLLTPEQRLQSVIDAKIEQVGADERSHTFTRDYQEGVELFPTEPFGDADPRGGKVYVTRVKPGEEETAKSQISPSATATTVMFVETVGPHPADISRRQSKTRKTDYVLTSDGITKTTSDPADYVNTSQEEEPDADEVNELLDWIASAGFEKEVPDESIEKHGPKAVFAVAKSFLDDRRASLSMSSSAKLRWKMGERQRHREGNWEQSPRLADTREASARITVDDARKLAILSGGIIAGDDSYLRKLFVTPENARYSSTPHLRDIVVNVRSSFDEDQKDPYAVEDLRVIVTGNYHGYFHGGNPGWHTEPINLAVISIPSEGDATLKYPRSSDSEETVLDADKLNELSAELEQLRSMRDLDQERRERLLGRKQRAADRMVSLIVTRDAQSMVDGVELEDEF